MPFQSEKQRRFLWAKHPDIAKRWADKYPQSNKNLPMYSDEKDQSEKDAALGALSAALVNAGVVQCSNQLTVENLIPSPSIIKSANDGLLKVDMPKTSGPVYAGQEQEAGQKPGPNPGAEAETDNKALDVKNPVAQKLAAILGPALRGLGGAQKAAFQAPHWAREMLAQQQGIGPAPQVPGVKRYASTVQTTPLPMGMQAPQPAAQPAGQPAAPQPSATSSAPGAPNMAAQSPSMAPIDTFGGLSKDPNNWGTPNAAFGQKNAPDSLKFSEESPRTLGYNAGMNRVNSHYDENLGRGALSGLLVGLVHEGLRPKTEEEAKQTALRKTLRYLASGATGATVGTAVRGGYAALTAPRELEKVSALTFGQKCAESLFSRVMINKPEAKPKHEPLVSSIAQQLADKLVPVSRAPAQAAAQPAKPGNSTNPPPGTWKTK